MASTMIVIASGYRNMSTGNDHRIIAPSPMVDIRKDMTQKPIAHTRYFGPRGKSSQNISPQLVMSPTAVLRQASVTITARMIPPTLPK